MKEALHGIWMEETQQEAQKSFGQFETRYGAKYPKAEECVRNYFLIEAPYHTKPARDLFVTYEIPLLIYFADKNHFLYINRECDDTVVA